MSSFIVRILNLNELEELANRKNRINKLNPSIKILLTIFYLLLVVSGSKYNITRLIYLAAPLILYVVISDVPFRVLGRKIFIPVLLSIIIGIPNPILNREIILSLGYFEISGGVLSLITLLIKSLLTFSITILLVATTTIIKIGEGLEALKVPNKIIILLLIIYRYIGVLLRETSQTIEACSIRSRTNSGIPISSWGSLVGQIFLRSYKRSSEIFNSMELRGYFV